MKKITKILLNIFGVIFTLAGILYMENYIVVALFLILGGLLLIPAIVTKILEKTKNNKIKSKYLYSIGIILVIIGCMFMPEQFVVTKSGNDELINKTQIKEGYIQYYGIKSARVALAPYKEMEIVEFIKNEELYPELFDYLTTTKTYEDDTKLYKDTNNTITIIICGKESKEKNIIIGNNKLKYKKGFCGMNTIPKEKKGIASVKKEEKITHQEEKTDNNKKDSQKQDEKKKSEKTKIQDNNSNTNIKEEKFDENNINKSITCNNKKITVKKLKRVTKNESNYVPSGKEWIGVYIIFENQGTDDIGYYESDFNLVNGNGEVIEPAFNIIKGVLDHDRLNNGTLVTGGIREGYVMFANDYINDKNLELRVVCEDKLIFDDDIRTIKLHS